MHILYKERLRIKKGSRLFFEKVVEKVVEK
jgi:hypothetical protein